LIAPLGAGILPAAEGLFRSLLGVCAGTALLHPNMSSTISTRGYKLKASLLLLVLWSLSPFAAMLSAQTFSSDAPLTANPVFQKNCAKCHGKTAEGRHFGGPALISEKAAAASAIDLNSIITNGKGHMPKYAGKLTTEEIDTLVQQIKELNNKK
jgi:mono/diheme cytochrome c family protein